MPASRKQIEELATRLGKGERTIWRWIHQGCDIDNPESIRQFLEGNKIRGRRVEKAQEAKAESRRNGSGDARNTDDLQAENAVNGRRSAYLPLDLPPGGRKGAAAALERLEETEERAHARLIALMEGGNSLAVRDQQDFWLKCSETLRRLDLAVEMARRDAEEQVPKKLAEEISLFISEWLRIAFTQFLSSELSILIGIKNFGEAKAYALERFHGILELTVKSSLQTKSPIPDWAASRVREAWNIA